MYKIFNHKSHNCRHQNTVSHVFHQTSSILQEDILKTSSVIYGSKFYCHERGSDVSIGNKMQRNKIVRFSQLSLWILQLPGTWHHSSGTPVNIYQITRYHRRRYSSIKLVTSPANQYINLGDGKTSSPGIYAGMDGKAWNKRISALIVRSAMQKFIIQH